MDKRETLGLLMRVRSGEVAPEDALARMCTEPFEDLGYAKPDHHRELRRGAAEAVYGAGKTPEQVIGIVNAMLGKGQRQVLITRLPPESAAVVGVEIPMRYHEAARMGVVGESPAADGVGTIVVASAGTSDMAAAEEAAVTAEAMGNDVARVYDVGVAGLHRLLSRMEVLAGASVVISVAGMEGALTSVIGGLVGCPVIGVPTSVGYGASFGGVSALLAMLNSCAPGVSVVNIDNGFGAGYLASVINHRKA